MPELKLAEYAFLSSGGPILVETDDVVSASFNFGPPNGFVRGTDFERPVLFFMAQPLRATKLNIYVGNIPPGTTPSQNSSLLVKQYEIGTGDNDDEQWRSMHQAINGQRFSSNPTQIIISPVVGRVRIQQVMLLFQFRFNT